MAWHSAGCPKEMPLTWWLTQHKAVYSAALSSSAGQNSVQSTCWPGRCGSQKVPFLFVSPAGTVWALGHVIKGHWPHPVWSSLGSYQILTLNTPNPITPEYEVLTPESVHLGAQIHSVPNINSLSGLPAPLTYLRVIVSIQGAPEEIEESKWKGSVVKIILQNQLLHYIGFGLFLCSAPGSIVRDHPWWC